MLLFCDGMMRSASTWVYNVVFTLLKAAFPDKDVRRTANANSIAAMEAMAGADWAIVKCHGLDENARAIFLEGKARAIYTHRDIYDAVASLLVMFRFSFSDVLQLMEASLDAYDFHCATGNYLCVDYESIAGNPCEVIRTISDFLDVSAPSGTIERIAEAHSLAAIKEFSSNLSLLGEDRVQSCSFTRYDRETQWHVRHVRNGGIGYGRRYLMPEQIEQLERLIRSRQGPSKDLRPVTPANVCGLAVST